MEKPACLFGKEFRLERQKRKISIWQVVHKTGNYLANIQRIEKGVTQPGITLSFKLLQALDTLPGDFLAELAEKYKDTLPASISPLANVEISYEFPLDHDLPKSLFGTFLHQVRMAACISQTAMAKAAGYNLRNINAAEKGNQEPGIMTALGLVLTTGVNVRDFFNQLFTCWREINGKVETRNK